MLSSISRTWLSASSALGVQLVHPAAQRAHLLDDLRRRGLSGGAGVADLAVYLVAPVANLVGFRPVAAPCRVQFQYPGHCVGFSAGFHGLADGVGVAAYLFNGYHSFWPRRFVFCIECR